MQPIFNNRDLCNDAIRRAIEHGAVMAVSCVTGASSIGRVDTQIGMGARSEMTNADQAAVLNTIIGKLSEMRDQLTAKQESPIITTARFNGV